jgi:putative transposase
MARLARIVIPGLPHHVTQRGNGRQKVFFTDSDYQLYVDLLVESCRAAGVSCWAYVLMPNHIHAILVPEDEDGLRACLAPVHRRYAGMVNARRRRTGHFWQGRYGAAAMDEEHLVAAFRYILRNPVVAGMVAEPERWKWSSAAAYLRGKPDGLTDTAPMLSRVPDMAALLKAGTVEDGGLAPPAYETIGRPRGSPAFITRLERKTGLTLRPGKRGPKPRKDS